MTPKLLHFIWAGGTRAMPAEGLANVARWAEANPDFAVRVWIDEQSDPDARGKYPAGLTLCDIGDLAGPPVEVRYELDGLWPNFGASSDLLRYAILHRLGGVYIDCLDVFPGPLPLGQVITEGPLLFHVTRHAVGIAPEGPGTEAIACAPGHPVMAELLAAARASYDGREWISKLLCWSAPDPDDRVWGRPQVVDVRELVRQRARDTLHLTGPGLVQRTLAPVPVMPARAVTLPPAHALSWAPLAVVPLPYPRALAAAARSMRFEAERMRLWNLDAHVEQVMLSSGNDDRARVSADLRAAAAPRPSGRP